MINLIKAADPQHFPIVYTLIGIYQTAFCRQFDCFDPDANALECLYGDKVHEPLLVGRVQWCIPGGVQDDGCFFFRVNGVWKYRDESRDWEPGQNNEQCRQLECHAFAGRVACRACVHCLLKFYWAGRQV